MTGHRKIRLAAALSLAAAGLAACEGAGQGAVAANPAICVDFKAAKAPAPGAPQDPGVAVDTCVQRWAYSLAPSRDDAAAAASAAVAACTPQLARWNQQLAAQPNPPQGEGTSITTGEPTNPVAERYAFATNRALLYVVQARAGRCAPPPAKDGVPDGIG